jgi:hypothetical protein
MATNLIETIQQKLEYPPLKKIDPNIQDIKDKDILSDIEKLAQAAIPAVFTALYKLSRNDEGSLKILKADTNKDSLFTLFNGKEDQVVENIAAYAGISANQAESHLENIADESIKLVKESIGQPGEPQKLKQFMNDQRHHILVYLPASLNLGDLLKDESLDDRTNKMEGPVSNFMHKIENKLSQGGE